MDTKIFVMTHKEISPLPSDIYIPLQVGKYGKPSFGYLSDDTGDNISAKNNSYCELTGIYWLWKNMSCDTIGICHYRRYFVHEENLLPKEDIENIISQFPIIVPCSLKVPDLNVYEQYKREHYAKDLLLCRDVISEKYPAYLPAFDYAMSISFITYANMWITKKEIFNRYCTWLFDILFEVEKRVDVSDYDDYQKRIMGFLSERLFRTWLFLQNEKIAEIPVKMMTPEDFFKKQNKADLISRYTRLALAPVLTLYQNQNIDNAYHSINTLNEEQKTPVWLFLPDEPETLPEVMQLCLKSIQQNLPPDKTSLYLITLDNCMNYVTLTDTIIQKFNANLIDLSMFSDILCAELLYRYGGMWIEPTYLIPKMLPKDFFNNSALFTLRHRNLSSLITGGNWTTDLWYTQKNSILFKFLTEAYWYYFENNDKFIDQHFSDYIITLAFNEIPYIKNLIENCEYMDKQTFILEKDINKKITEERIYNLNTNALFYKLNPENDYQKNTLTGELTLYGYLIKTFFYNV